MSLNWNIRSVREYEELVDGGRESAITEMLVWATMAIGLGDITEKNADEFYARVKLAEKLTGTFGWVEGKNYSLQPEDVQRRIGLSTNVTDEARSTWLKRYVGYDLDAWKRGYAQQAEKVTA